MTKKKTPQLPELLIGKTKQMLRAALVEKLLAWEQWKRTPEGRTSPASRNDYQVSKQSGEVTAAARRLACVERCLEFEILWMNSAWAMFEALRPKDAGSGESMVPQNHFWFEFETPRQTPVGEMAAFLIINRDDTDLLVEIGPYIRSDWQWSERKKADLKRQYREEALSSPETNLHWYEIGVVNSEGAITWSVAFTADVEENTIIWHFSRGYACPTGECEVLERELRDEMPSEGVPACPTCQHTVEYFQTWLSIAYQMMRGDFQETEEAEEDETVFVTEEIEERDPSRPSRTLTRRLTHRMSVMRFDASMKRKPSDHHGKRGAWMAGRSVVESDYEADENAVIFVKMEYREHERTFRHERYKAAQGTTRSFPANIRPQQMTVREYKARRETGEVSSDGIFHAKQKRPKRYMRVSASAYG
jgi:hypothetical protein